MSPFWKKDESIESRINRYFDQSDAFFTEFEKAFKMFIKDGCTAAFEASVDRAHQIESQTDDLRRDIELTLYGRQLLPESRGDVLGLLEAYDKILGAAEVALYEMRNQRMCVPTEFAASFERLVELNLQAFFLVRKTVDALLNNPRVTLSCVKEVDAKESQSDRQERKLVEAIFTSDIPKADQLQLRWLIGLVSTISDLSEHTADRIGIIAIKRKI